MRQIFHSFHGGWRGRGFRDSWYQFSKTRHHKMVSTSLQTADGYKNLANRCIMWLKTMLTAPLLQERFQEPHGFQQHHGRAWRVAASFPAISIRTGELNSLVLPHGTKSVLYGKNAPLYSNKVVYSDATQGCHCLLCLRGVCNLTTPATTPDSRTMNNLFSNFQSNIFNIHKHFWYNRGSCLLLCMSNIPLLQNYPADRYLPCYVISF